VPPPPPPPVAPPPALPGVCSEGCNGIVVGAAPGICDDGVGLVMRNGLQPLCAPGTDCADCGVRAFCNPGTSCPMACYQRAMARPAEACLESMVSNGMCDPQCNNRECSFDG
jgi:hypothetical protein